MAHMAMVAHGGAFCVVVFNQIFTFPNRYRYKAATNRYRYGKQPWILKHRSTDIFLKKQKQIQIW